MKAQSFGNDFWTFTIKDTLYSSNPNGLSGFTKSEPVYSTLNGCIATILVTEKALD